MTMKILFLLFFNVIVILSRSQAEINDSTVRFAVAEQLLSERCSRQVLALNDCNWCRCNKESKYICSARNCQTVDMFGHFNDAIRNIHVGMEGHGVWRSTENQCEAGVHYVKDELLCICTEDGQWPNSVCRDIFQVLHNVEPTKYNKPDYQSCSPNKLYQVGCNVCYCMSSGVINPDHCTKTNCRHDVVQDKKLMKTKINNIMPVEVYASCIRGKTYTIDCQTCICLPNNRLLCDNCTRIFKEDNSDDSSQLKQNSINLDSNINTLCSGVKPREKFQNKCNTCYCDENNVLYCTVLNCLKLTTNIAIPQIDYENVLTPIDDHECIPYTSYKRDCNTCHCFMLDGVKYFGCTLKRCGNGQNLPKDSYHCITGTKYEKNCLICQCVMQNGVKNEICTYNEKCRLEKGEVIKNVPTSLKSMHGYCEPLHTYVNECNKCKCLSKGQVIACTSKICSRTSLDKLVNIELIPFVLNQKACISGTSYYVDCNFCYCLSSGNTICTTKRCETYDDKILGF